MKRKKAMLPPFLTRQGQSHLESAISQATAECLEQSHLQLLASATRLKRLADQLQRLSPKERVTLERLLDLLRFQSEPKHSAEML